MLVHSKSGRWAAWGLFGLLFLPLFALPLLVVVAASFSTHWSGAFPSGATTENYASAVRGESLQALTTSLVTALTASLLALTVGTWAALAAAGLRKRGKRSLDALFMLPVAVPSVVVGLAVLVAFSRPPVLLNGTSSIVILAHTILVTAFAYQSVSAAIVRLDPAYEQAAASSGRVPATCCGGSSSRSCCRPSPRRGLCFALSMGELSATMMLYPRTGCPSRSASSPPPTAARSSAAPPWPWS